MSRALGYLLGAASASIFYIVWLAIQAASPGLSLRFRIGFAFFFWLVDGFCLALILMSAPWILAVKLYPGWSRAGWVYFVTMGGFLTFIIACITASLSPKPFFVEQQTFLAGLRIAAEREGTAFAVAGLVHGLIYWLASEKERWRASAK